MICFTGCNIKNSFAFQSIQTVIFKAVLKVPWKVTWNHQHNENYSYIYRGMTKSQRRMSERDREKVMKRALCFQSARMSLSFRPCWIPAIQMTGVHRPSLQRVSPSPSQQQLPFMRLCWLWGHLLRTALMKHTHIYIHAYADTHTHTHTKLLTSKCQLRESEGHQRWLLSAYAHVWFCVNGTQGRGGLWYHRVLAEAAHSLARSGVSRCLKGWVGDKPKVFNQNEPLAFFAGFIQHSDVGGPGDLWAYGALPYVAIVPWTVYRFRRSTQYGFHCVPIQSLVFKLNTKDSGEKPKQLEI